MGCGVAAIQSQGFPLECVDGDYWFPGLMAEAGYRLFRILTTGRIRPFASPTEMLSTAVNPPAA